MGSGPASHSLRLTGPTNTGASSAHSRDGKWSHVVASVCPSLAVVRLGVFIHLRLTWISFSGLFCSFFYWIIGLSLLNPCLPPWSLLDLSPQTIWMTFPPIPPWQESRFPFCCHLELWFQSHIVKFSHRNSIPLWPKCVSRTEMGFFVFQECLVLGMYKAGIWWILCRCI